MQSSLFQAIPTTESCQIHDLGNASLREYVHAFTPAQADDLLQNLLSAIPWHQAQLKIAGRTIPVPRLQCWMGDKQSLYGYSGMRLTPEPWNAVVQTIRTRVQDLAGVEFNSVLLNYYRDGQDSVSWHADDEPELGTDPVIGSVSFGAERPFQLKPKFNRPNSPRSESLRMMLHHGSLLVMDKGTQRYWQHQLPKLPGLKLPRVNLTFRQIR
jgi:alkylated DNA repair dioxygenase AlkB